MARKNIHQSKRIKSHKAERLNPPFSPPHRPPLDRVVGTVGSNHPRDRRVKASRYKSGRRPGTRRG